MPVKSWRCTSHCSSSALNGIELLNRKFALSGEAGSGFAVGELDCSRFRIEKSGIALNLQIVYYEINA